MPKGDMCAKFQSSRTIFILISCNQLSSVANSCQQLLTADNSLHKKMKQNFHLQPKGDMCAKFQSSRTIFIFISCYQLSSVVNNFQQLLTADNSCYTKKLNRIFIYSLKVMCAKFQSSRTIFIFICFYQLSSVVNSCQQLLTASNRGYELF